MRRAVTAKTRMSRAGNRGFTLFELLIVLVIIGLAGSVVVISAGRMRDKAVFGEEARRIYLTLKHAREMAILERRETVFRIDEEANKYWIDLGGERTEGLRSAPGGIVIRGEDIFFFPKGDSSGGLVEVDNGKGQRYAVEVSPVIGTPAIKRI